MKQVLLIGLALFLSFLSLSFTDGKNTCSQYKDGTFWCYLRGGGKQEGYICVRKGEIQTDTNYVTGAWSKASIKWLSECVFEMRLIATNRKLTRAAAAQERKMVTTVCITGGTDKYYLFTASCNLHDITLSDTVWIKK